MRGNRAWIYCRTAGDCDIKLDAMRMQRRRLEQYAAQHNMCIVGYSEDRQTGTTIDRPGMQKMKEAVEQYAVDAILVFSLDRLCRDTGEAIRYWQYLQDHNVCLSSMREGEISLSRAGEILSNLGGI